jgi:hypothetical protein
MSHVHEVGPGDCLEIRYISQDRPCAAPPLPGFVQHGDLDDQVGDDDEEQGWKQTPGPASVESPKVYPARSRLFIHQNSGYQEP